MLIIEGSDCLGKTTFANLLFEVAKEMIHNQGLHHIVYQRHMTRPIPSFDFFYDYQDMISKFAIQDRFHLGGIVWHDKISQAELEIIEGWLQSVGSMTVIFYTSEMEWYRERLGEDERGNLLSIDKMFQANVDYKDMVHRIYKRTPKVNCAFNMNGINYPTRSDAVGIINAWFERLSLLET